MDIWDKLATPPRDALKTISGGRLAGKSDINPQWRYKVMTEVFGACGIGWKYSIDKLWTEPGTEGEVFAFAQVSVYTKATTEGMAGPTGGYWSAPIPGVGGHKLIESERAGLHNNDEAFKMAVTDALSVALKMLGVAAEVYLGHFDSKYAGNPNGPTSAPQRTQMFDRACTKLEEGATGGGLDGLQKAWSALTVEERRMAGVAKRMDELKTWCVEQETGTAGV